MGNAPWTDLGRLESDISSIKTELSRKVENHEFHSLRSRVDSVEHSVREVRSLVDGMEFRLQEVEQKLQELEFERSRGDG